MKLELLKNSWLVAAVIGSVSISGLGWYLTTWNTYDQGDISFRYPNTWETYHFGDSTELYVTPILPSQTNQGLTIIADASESRDLACGNCKNSTTTSIIHLGTITAEKQLIQRISPNGSELPYENDLVVVKILPQYGLHNCGDYEFRYHQASSPKQQHIINQIIASFTCSMSGSS